MKHATLAALAVLGVSAWAAAPAPAAQPAPAPAPAAPAEGVILAPRLKAGDSFTYDIARTLRVEQTEPASASPPTVSESSLSMTVRFDVGVVRADGTTQVACEIQRLEVRLDRAGSPVTFVHPAEEPEKADDKPSGALATVGAYLVGRRPRLVIDREGRLGALEGLDELPEIAGKAMKTDRSVSPDQMSILGVDRFRDALLPIFQPAAPELPTRLFRAGDTWSARRNVKLADLGSMTISHAWTVSSLGESVRAAAVITAKAEPPRGIVSAAPALTLRQSSGDGQINWNPALARLDQRKDTLSLSTRYALGPIEIDQVETTSLEITRAGTPETPGAQ